MKLTLFISEIQALEESGPRQDIAIHSIEYKCESKKIKNIKIINYSNLND